MQCDYASVCTSQHFAHLVTSCSRSRGIPSPLWPLCAYLRVSERERAVNKAAQIKSVSFGPADYRAYVASPASPSSEACGVQQGVTRPGEVYTCSWSCTSMRGWPEHSLYTQSLASCVATAILQHLQLWGQLQAFVTKMSALGCNACSSS